jgi:hypothetical protein
MIDDVMDSFEFHKVERHMQQVQWGWAKPTTENKWNLEIPDVFELKAALRKLLVNVCTSMTMEKESNPDVSSPHFTSCGGFTVYVWPDDTAQVFFSVTDWWVDSDMLDSDE